MRHAKNHELSSRSNQPILFRPERKRRFEEHARGSPTAIVQAVATAQDRVQLRAPNEPAALTWDDLSWLRSLTQLTLILKGLCHPEDVRRIRKQYFSSDDQLVTLAAELPKPT